MLEANSRKSISSEALGQGSRSDSAGLLEEASDWEVAAGLVGRRNCPAVFKENVARPGIVALSTIRRTAVLVELTVPFEANMSESHEFKLAKYEVLREALHADGYKAHLFAVEVGARGFAGASVYSLLKRLDVSSKARSRCIKAAAEAAERSSYWIWLKRDTKEWKPMKDQ